MWNRSPSGKSGSGSSTWSPAYKIEAAAHVSQSVLSTLVYHIFLCFTKLWQLLHSRFFQFGFWKSFCANMTIEVSTVDVVDMSSSAALPILRINSTALDDIMNTKAHLDIMEDLEDLELEQAEQEAETDAILEHIVFSDSDNCSNPDQGKLIRRDSDTSDVSSSDSNVENTKPISPEVAERIINQVESMFSDDHLAKDGFLLKHVRRRSDGFVSLKLVAGLRKVKQISREFPVVMNALRKSEKLDVNSEGTKIRRVEPLTPFLKSIPTAAQNKDKKDTKDNKDSSSDDQQQQINRNQNSGRNVNNTNNSGHNNNNSTTTTPSNNKNNKYDRQAQRKISNVSSASSNSSSRHGSFSSGKPHPADLFRNVMSASSSGEDSPQVARRRGGSLPIPTGVYRPSPYQQTSPNSSPPTGFLRSKSHSYCEGTNPSTMSPWLLRRKEASRNSDGSVVISGVIRQPRGPDGTKGFASGYRTLILQEKDRLNNSQSALSA